MFLDGFDKKKSIIDVFKKGRSVFEGEGIFYPPGGLNWKGLRPLPPSLFNPLTIDGGH